MKVKRGCVLLLVLLLIGCKEEEVPVSASCNSAEQSIPSTKGKSPDQESWLYQLQLASPKAINKTSFDVITMDYSRDGSKAGKYTKAQIKSMQDQGKVVLAYFSIGEAEDYRAYWKNSWNNSAPCWLGKENADWAGNYKVQFWQEEWQAVLLVYLDEIIDQGFDGVYLDIIDAYWYWTQNNGEGLKLSEKESAGYMINLVKRIAYHARVTRNRSGFFVYPQNAEDILRYDSDGSYLKAISGIGVEDLFYLGTEGEQSQASQDWRLPYLRKIHKAGKQVLVIEYVDDGSGYSSDNQTRIDDALALIDAEGFLPYLGREDRELDSINLIEGVQP